MKNKVIVTGGCGFIGSNLVSELLLEGYNVHVIDDYSTYEGKPLPYPNQVVLGPQTKSLDENKVTIHKMDIRKGYQELHSIFDGAKYAFHLAARPRVEESIQDPITFNEVNVNGSLNVFVAAKKAGVDKLIFSSTCALYGDAKIFPTPEDMPMEPLSPYAAHKLMGEIYLKLFNRLYGLNSVALRYFNVYGERQPTKGPYVPVVGIFQRQKESGEPLTITGDGLQSRDFVHVKDVARANILAATSEKTNKGFHAFNIGTGKNHQILDIAREISDDIKHIEPRVEPRKTQCDPSKARNVLGWEPTVELFNWIKNNI